MKKFLATLALVAGIFGTTVHAMDVTLLWNPSTDPNFAGFNVYYGNVKPYDFSTKIDVGANTQITLTSLQAGDTYYITLTEFDIFGLESDYAPEIIYTVPFSDILVSWSTGQSADIYSSTSPSGPWTYEGNLISPVAFPHDGKEYFMSPNARLTVQIVNAPKPQPVAPTGLSAQ